MKRIMKSLTITSAILFFAVPSFAGWLIFHKPAYKGKVIDVDTKEPIEGAVVVAIYHEYPIISGPAGGSSTVINVREALTDKEGKFQIPSYTTLIPPIFREDDTLFIIFKPGYASVSNLNLEDDLSNDTGKEVELPWLYNQEVKFKFAPRVIGLPRLKTREERIKASMVGITGYHAKDLPLLYKVINEEDRYLGIPERE